MKVSVGSPERAKAVEAAERQAAILAAMEAEEEEAQPEEETQTSEVPSSSGAAELRFVATPADAIITQPVYAMAPIRPSQTLPPDSEQIVIKNKKVPVSLIVDSGVNALTAVPTMFTLAFDAYDVQVNDDLISVMYKSTFSVTPPSFTKMRLVVRGTRYDVMCIGVSKKFDEFIDLNFMIVANTQSNGETSNS